MHNIVLFIFYLYCSFSMTIRFHCHLSTVGDTSLRATCTYSGINNETICLKLPDSWLQFFIHLSVGMNPSQGIYRGKGDALVSCCYNTIDHSLRVYCGLTHYHKNLKTDQDKLLLQCIYCCTCFDTS